MNPEARRLVERLWNYCNVLRDDGVSSIDYLEQLSFLVFLKMADEIEKLNAYLPAEEHEHVLPTTDEWKTRGWSELVRLEGDPLEQAYTKLLTDLGHRSAADDHTTLSLIFNRARNRIENPANLRRLIVDLINEEKWYEGRSDIKGAAYEALVQRTAQDTKAGAGQYFTPRVLIESIVRCMRPTPQDTITDPACGTGGFLLAAYQQIIREYGKDLPDEALNRLRTKAIWGTELVPSTARLAAMNLLLHSLGDPVGQPLIEVRDALEKPSDRLASMVLANPPFGRASKLAISGGNGDADDGNRDDVAYYRPDFWLGDLTTTNKQLNFLQHIGTLLTDRGRAAVVLPDNVLFEGGKNSAGAQIRRELLTNYNLHTMLRLPDNIFLAGGVKANVLFFDAVPDHREDDDPPNTGQLWVYDLRTGSSFTLKQRPLKAEHLADFEHRAFPADDPHRQSRKERQSDLFRPFDARELLADQRVSLDIGLLDPSASEAGEPPSIEQLTVSAADDLRQALAEIEAFAQELGVELPEVSRN
ncbi:class I SAM-dependent DNA methyltransferase [Streptomyces sp. Root369]|uniref:class I SAM-dependent DNA methyltransferase n=1 Tax=Streptomyces sp. Root369 TaxID=1736523 RepID=UPI000708F26F|nr:class I SAM-dependent DNA methyltransferase [Streptomyces sp. Root369]KQW09522.1 DNA methyltransferase [Streptomyces sp. Root369]